MIAFIIVYIQVHEVDFSVVQNIASWLLHSACLTVIWSYNSIYIIYMHIHTQSYKDLCVFCLANGDAIKLYLSFADLFVMLLKNIACTIYLSWAVAKPRFWFEGGQNEKTINLTSYTINFVKLKRPTWGCSG